MPKIDERRRVLAPDRKAVVRDMLRYGKYKPTGRGKPAGEYLLRVAQEDRFPMINNLVDALNLVSFNTQLPISILDTDLANTDQFRFRRGYEAEAFVFNAGGQWIQLQDLLLISTLPEDQACANPVKDFMRTKLTERSKNMLCVIYAPKSLEEGVLKATESLTQLYGRYGGDQIAVRSAVL